MRMFLRINLILSILVMMTACSTLKPDNIKDWLKEGTKDHQETVSKTNKTGKTNLKDFLSKNGCINGSSAKIIETKDKEFLLYEVTCVKNSKKFVVKCNESSCSK